jgi:hypothetical protein
VNEVNVFGPDTDLPVVSIGKHSHAFFKSSESVDQWLLALMDDICASDKIVGLDAEFDRYTKELTMLTVSFSKTPVCVIHIPLLNGRFPEQLKLLFGSKQFEYAARNIGVDCGKLETQFGIFIPRRRELRDLASDNKGELGSTFGGTSLENLVNV